MKEGIHPEYKELRVMMNDGTEFVTRSTMKTPEGVFRPDVDSSNHPFYIGATKMISSDGRVDRFNKRFGKK